MLQIDPATSIVHRLRRAARSRRSYSLNRHFTIQATAIHHLSISLPTFTIISPLCIIPFVSPLSLPLFDSLHRCFLHNVENMYKTRVVAHKMTIVICSRTHPVLPSRSSTPSLLFLSRAPSLCLTTAPTCARTRTSLARLEPFALPKSIRL